MLLDLFITHYDEPWEIGRAGFEILKNQRLVDWDRVRVTVVHDGTEPFPEEQFEDYPFRVTQVSIPHGGIAKARNWCIDHSDAEWIKWNDFDDMFTGIYALRSLMDSLESGRDYDLLWFEVYADMEGRRYLKAERDPVVLHGKAFRRQFLIDHQLRFKEDLTWCEDSAFLAVLEMEIDQKRIGKIRTDAPIYAWLHRPGSLCNREEIRFQNLQSFFRRHCYVAEEFRKRGLTDAYHTMIARIMCDSYYTLQIAEYPEDRSRHERAVWNYFRKHRDDFLKCRKSAFDQVIAATNRENENCDISRDEVIGWLKALRMKYEEE